MPAKEPLPLPYLGTAYFCRYILLMRRKCPFCGETHDIVPRVTVGYLCGCGAYGQADYKCDAHLFPSSAGQWMELKEFAEGGDGRKNPGKYLHIRSGGTLAFDRCNSDMTIIFQWAKAKAGTEKQNRTDTAL